MATNKSITIKVDIGKWKVVPSIKLLLDAIRTDCMSNAEIKINNIFDINEPLDNNTRISKIDNNIQNYFAAMMDWYDTFSSKFLSIMLGVMLAIFAYCWYSLLKLNISNSIFLWIAIAISFIYIANEIIRFFIITQSMRNLKNNLCSKIRKYNDNRTEENLKDIESYIDQIYNIREYFHNITWLCVIFQIVLFSITILVMGAFLILSFNK